MKTFNLIFVIVFSILMVLSIDDLIYAQLPTEGTPDRVVGLTATSVSTSQIDLSWDEPYDNGSPITGYQIERKTGNDWIVLVSSTGTTNRTYSDTDLEPNTLYAYRVAAINAEGIGRESAPSSDRTFSPPTTPHKPRALTAVPGNGSILLSWKEPAKDGGSPIIDYVIEYSSDNGNTWTLYEEGISTFTQTLVTGLYNHQYYLLRVSAVNSVGSSDYSKTNAMPDDSHPSERGPPKIMGIGYYQIDTVNISDTYSKILLGSDIDDMGFFHRFVPYSTKSDKIDQEQFGGFDNYEKRGQYLNLDENFIFPTFFGKVDKPIQIQIRLEDQYASTKIEHLSLYADNQSSDKSQSKLELIWNKGDTLSIIDENDLIKSAHAYESLEDGFLWVVFDLTFQKEMKKSNIFLETWHELRRPTTKILYDAFEVSKSDFKLQQRVSLRVDVDVSHDTSNPVCKVSGTCFTPNNAKILRGGVVSWINNDVFMHDIESGTPGKITNEFDLHIMPGETLQKKFEREGVFSYFCRIHPWSTGMITVISEKEKTDILHLPPEQIKPVLLVASETSLGSVMIENRGTIHLPNKDLSVEISGHIDNRKKGQPLEITILKPDGTIDRLRASTIGNGYYFLNAKLDKSWQDGEFTVTTHYKKAEIGSITFNVIGKESDGFGGILYSDKPSLENKIAAYINSDLSLDELNLWLEKNGYEQKFVEFLHHKLSVFGL